ncbi:hypothetical protein [Aliivibrio kagoshimensis]|uniref:hypothetical protein n=1 Tax=Aliivibrio kagoshimensis TaxID=2910230 RepID=UPI003D109A14
MSTEVRTKEELTRAKDREENEIIVVGKLADELKKTKKLAYVGTGTLDVLTTALVATPFTGGMSMFAAAPLAALTGMEISGIIIAASLGITLVIAVFKGYDEISYKKGELILKRKSS